MMYGIDLYQWQYINQYHMQYQNRLNVVAIGTCCLLSVRIHRSYWVISIRKLSHKLPKLIYIASIGTCNVCMQQQKYYDCYCMDR